jgi:hypothetical protein
MGKIRRRRNVIFNNDPAAIAADIHYITNLFKLTIRQQHPPVAPNSPYIILVYRV